MFSMYRHGTDDWHANHQSRFCIDGSIEILAHRRFAIVLFWVLRKKHCSLKGKPCPRLQVPTAGIGLRIVHHLHSVAAKKFYSAVVERDVDFLKNLALAAVNTLEIYWHQFL